MIWGLASVPDSRLLGGQVGEESKAASTTRVKGLDVKRGRNLLHLRNKPSSWPSRQWSGAQRRTNLPLDVSFGSLRLSCSRASLAAGAAGNTRSDKAPRPEMRAGCLHSRSVA